MTTSHFPPIPSHSPRLAFRRRWISEDCKNTPLPLRVQYHVQYNHDYNHSTSLYVRVQLPLKWVFPPCSSSHIHRHPYLPHGIASTLPQLTKYNMKTRLPLNKRRFVIDRDFDWLRHVLYLRLPTVQKTREDPRYSVGWADLAMNLMSFRCSGPNMDWCISWCVLGFI